MASADLIAGKLLEILSAARKPAEKPPGFITAQEAAQAWGCQRVTARAKLHEGYKDGLFERRQWGRCYVYAAKSA